MNEEPKSIWKKSWTGWRGLGMGWLILSFALIIIYLIWLMASGTPLAKSGGESWLFVVAWTGATIIFLLAIFIRWLCCRRNFKRFLFGLACLVTLVALIYAEEDWRGWHAWNQFKHEWEAKGEHFDFASIIPPPVPDDQNFAMAPIFDATDKLASRKWRHEHTNPHPGANGPWWDTNLVDPLEMETADYGYVINNESTNGYWAKGTLTDLSGWQNYYHRLAAKTNEFPVSSQTQTPAQVVLLALSKYNPAIEGLRQASLRPDSRFPLDYDDEDPAEILLPHLAALKRCCQTLRLRALAELQNGETEKACDDVKLCLRLAGAVETEPFIITHLVRIAILNLTLQPVYEGLAEHKWSDAQLSELDAELAKLNFLADYEYSTRSERAAHIKIVDWIEQKRSRYWVLVDWEDSNERAVMNNFWRTMQFYLMPKGWFYQSDIAMSEVHQKWIQPMVDDANQTVSPKRAREATDAVSHLKPTTMNLFARLLLPEVGKYAMRVAQGQTAANEARIAIALERHRLMHGDFPDSLDALAPQFMEKVPHDIINGGPLHYRLSSDGQFVLYSVGWNETDDGGVVIFEKGSAQVVDYNQGDWVWRYPQK